MAEQDRVVAIFKNQPRLDKGETKKQGRPIYRDVEVCEIRFAANRNTVGVFPAHAFAGWRSTPEGGQEEYTYAMKFPEQYKRFKAGQTQVADGTPLEELPFLTQAKRMELKALNVHTAEALAAVDGQELKNLGMGGRALKDQAQAYLDNASGTAKVTALASENEDLRKMVEDLQREMKSMKPDAPSDRTESEFEDWEDDLIKEYIEEKTGSKPRGNPKHSTLVDMAEEVKRAA